MNAFAQDLVESSIFCTLGLFRTANGADVIEFAVV